jgi:site-specific recombinase XerD
MRRHFRGEVRLKHLSQSGFFPSGNPRWYYKPKGQKGIALPDAPKESPTFLQAYVTISGKAPAPKPKTFGAGSLGAGVAAYLGSTAFLGMASSTRERWRSRCDDIRSRYGAAVLDELSARNIKQDLAKHEGHSRNNRLKVWRSLCAFWDEKGLIEINVARQVSKSKTEETDGHLPWTRADFAAFRAHWAIGTKERLAFELMYRTCAAIGDTCGLTRGQVKDGWLTYTRQKSKSIATAPFFLPGPEWFGATDDLQSCLAVEEKHVTFLTTKTGKSRSPKSAASWFSKAAKSAGLDMGKTAHGIRKGRAAMFKENGASADQRMAILGHETVGEATRYSKSADLRRTVEGTQKFQLSEQVPTEGNNPLKRKAQNNG